MIGVVLYAVTTCQRENSHEFWYLGLGDRLSQTVGITTTRYVLDPATGLTQVLSDGTNSYLYGNGRLAQYQTTMQYFGVDGLGSVRQLYDASGQVIATNRYDPYGNLMSHYGDATSVYGFTGEQYDAATGLEYLRARYYSPAQGRFMTRDTWQGDPNAPMSYNGWSYANGNPINLTDPSGNTPTYPTCPMTTEDGHRTWDCMAVHNVWAEKRAFLESAARHNKIPNMDNNGFAALIASVIISESRFGNIPPWWTARGVFFQGAENFLAGQGCLVSGKEVLDAAQSRDIPRLIRYLTNHDIPLKPTVGIGNVYLETGKNLWAGQACSSEGACEPVSVSKMKARDGLGNERDIPNPFDPAIYRVCADPNEPTCFRAKTEEQSFQQMERQLLQHKVNIEYVAANLEAGAQRARKIELVPSAFNSATWHLRGLQTDEEMNRASPWRPCPDGACLILESIPIALKALQVTSNWSLNTEPQYATWKTR